MFKLQVDETGYMKTYGLLPVYSESNDVSFDIAYPQIVSGYDVSNYEPWADVEMFYRAQYSTLKEKIENLNYVIKDVPKGTRITIKLQFIEPLSNAMFETNTQTLQFLEPEIGDTSVLPPSKSLEHELYEKAVADIVIAGDTLSYYNVKGELVVSHKITAEQIGAISETMLFNHTSNKFNPHSVTAEQVGLGNVDNTADVDKPVSTPQQAALDGKVDKVTGKELSSNDFTNAEKTKLGGVESGAEVNKIETIKVDGVEQTITDKTVELVSGGNSTYYCNATIVGTAINMAMDKPAKLKKGDVIRVRFDKAYSGYFYQAKFQNDTAKNCYPDAFVFNGVGFISVTDMAEYELVYNESIFVLKHPTVAPEIIGLIDNKVDKAAGKDLSTNDYTTAEKNKLASLVGGNSVYTAEPVYYDVGSQQLNVAGITPIPSLSDGDTLLFTLTNDANYTREITGIYINDISTSYQVVNASDLTTPVFAGEPNVLYRGTIADNTILVERHIEHKTYLTTVSSADDYYGYHTVLGMEKPNLSIGDVIKFIYQPGQAMYGMQEVGELQFEGSSELYTTYYEGVGSVMENVWYTATYRGNDEFLVSMPMCVPVTVSAPYMYSINFNQPHGILHTYNEQLGKGEISLAPINSVFGIKIVKSGLNIKIPTGSTQFNLLQYVDYPSDVAVDGNGGKNMFSITNMANPDAMLKFPINEGYVDYSITVRLIGVVAGSGTREFYIDIARADYTPIDGRDVVKVNNSSLSKRGRTIETATIGTSDPFSDIGMRLTINNPSSGSGEITLAGFEILVKGRK